jgi:hypothetical protein
MTFYISACKILPNLAVIVLTAALVNAAEPPPSCPKGSGPLRVNEGTPTGPLKFRWHCEPNLFWPTGDDLEESDRTHGTHLEGIYQSAACVPPTIDCGSRAGALADPSSVSGWRCLSKPECPPKTSAALIPQGWQCVSDDHCPAKDPASCNRNPACKWTPEVLGFPAACIPREICPSGTTFVGECCASCAPSDEISCKRLTGWKWIPRHWNPVALDIRVSGLRPLASLK